MEEDLSRSDQTDFPEISKTMDNNKNLPNKENSKISVISTPPVCLPRVQAGVIKSSQAKEEKESYSKNREKIVNNGTHRQKRLMLLNRLLSRSIQHERNLICQSIKYIADNNFFD